ncbi:hypothetical protein B7494_g1506 [Chlorociboria aeruginascens]|nr:hypothetical protein B7494_g1506 [Chlorociboria aeruginascens]
MVSGGRRPLPVKRSSTAETLSLERLIRDGPPDDDLAGALESTRLKILDQGIKSDTDGMSSLRIYVWLILLNAPVLETDSYLSLIHRGASPAYSKIRNDTFRTLATDPLFRRRVSEASLIRLLNAVAWKLHDAKEERAQKLAQTSDDKLVRTATVHGSPESPSSKPALKSRARALTLTTEGSDAGTSEPGTYVQGMNVLAAPFLYAARSEAEAFVAFHRFITHECPGYVRGAMDGVHKGLGLVDKVLAIVDPKLSLYLVGKGMNAELYAFPSVLTLCACTPPLPEVLRLWDFLFAYGAHLNILCIVAQLIILRNTILSSPRCLTIALAIGSQLSVSYAALDVSLSLQDVLNKAHQGPLYLYPTSFTQGIVPKGIHSHNDYWRDVPFYTALSVGAVSTEADVWLYGDKLYVGHEQGALTVNRTFESLYINPILDVLKRQNPSNSSFLTSPTYNGVFDTSGGQTLYLFVDLKTDGPTTWPAVVKALQPLRSAGFLSTVNGTTFTSGAVTVIGTGNTPLNLVQPITNRDYFWDAPIPTLNSTYSNITNLVSPIASTDFAANFGPVLGTSLNSTQLDLLRAQVETAHAKGIALRYWDQPGWPISTRNGIWRQLTEEGVDLINADDVVAAAGFAGNGEGW